MPARAIWEGTIGFGLVQIPVGLYSAESRDELDFDMLDRRDMSPVGYQRYNRETGEPVEWGDIVKGYAVKKGEYVILENEDFKRASVKATQTVDIVQFAGADEIDPTYYEKPYYLVPGKRGVKPYVLLREALRKSGKVGIARVVIRSRESLAAVMVKGDALVLELLRYAHELAPAEDYDLPHAGKDAPKLSAPELKMAERLIDEMTAEFKPDEFKDTYRDDLLAFIKRKYKGEEVEEVDVEAEAPSNVVDMMALLKKSLGQGKTAAKTVKGEKADKAKNKPKRTTTRNVRPIARAKKATQRKKPARRKATTRKAG